MPDKNKYPLDRANTVRIHKLLCECERELFLHAANKFKPKGDVDWPMVSLLGLKDVMYEILGDKVVIKPTKKQKKAKEK